MKKMICLILCCMMMALSACAEPAFYSVCTGFSKDEVEQFAAEVRDMILASDWTALSERIAYPISIGGAVYEDSTAFVMAPFETMLNPEAIESIQNETCTDMFCKFSGIMMGNGEVWISEVLNEDFTSAGLRVIGLEILLPEETEIVPETVSATAP